MRREVTRKGKARIPSKPDIESILTDTSAPRREAAKASAEEMRENC